MDEYKKKAAMRHHIFVKYSKLLSFDPREIAIGRIQNFLKKRFLFQVENISDEELKSIPGIYRYRFVLPLIDDIENIIKEFNEERLIANEIDDYQIREVRMHEIKTYELEFLAKISSKYPNINVLIDTRKYGILKIETKWFINIKDKVYEIPENLKIKIKNAYAKINIVEVEGEKFLQMLEWSKILSNAYKKSISDT